MTPERENEIKAIRKVVDRGEIINSRDAGILLAEIDRLQSEPDTRNARVREADCVLNEMLRLRNVEKGRDSLIKKEIAYLESERKKWRDECEHLRHELEKKKQDMHLVVSDAGKDLLKERDALKAENEKLRRHSIIHAERYCTKCAHKFPTSSEIEAQNEYLKKAVSHKLEEDSDYCREFSAVLVLQEENEKLKERIRKLRMALNKYNEAERILKDGPDDSDADMANRLISEARKALYEDDMEKV